MTTFERNVSQLEERLKVTVDVLERERLLRLLIREERNFVQNEAFLPTLERQIASRDKHIQKQRALIARLKLPYGYNRSRSERQSPAPGTVAAR